MIQARARVLRVDGDQAWVKMTDSAGGCGRCDEPGGCRSVQITQAFGAGRREFRLPMRVPVAVGDEVVISIPDGAPLKVALASYGLATLLLLLGAALGTQLGGATHGDALALAGAALGLLLAWRANRLLMRSRLWREQMRMDLAPASACLHSFQEVR